MLSYIDRLKAQGGDPNAKQDLADAKKYGQKGLEGLPKFTKPEARRTRISRKMKDQMTGIFNAAIGIADITDKDYNTAGKDLRAAGTAAPTCRRISAWFIPWRWPTPDPLLLTPG